MLKLNNFNNFFKVAKICIFLSLNIKNKDKHLKFKVFMFSNSYTFYNLWKFLIFFYKLRFIFKKILRNKGFFAILNNNKVLESALNFFFSYKNTIYFFYEKSLFENKHFLKNFINFNNVFFLENSKSYKIISFIFVCLNKFNRLEKQKIGKLQTQNIPFLFFSEFFFKNVYWIPLNFFDFKKVFFWLFLTFNIFFEEFFFLLKNEKK